MSTEVNIEQNAKEIIHVAMSSDDHYIQYLTVAVCSILKNLSERYSLNLYVLHQGLSDVSRSSIEQLQQVRSFNCEFIEADIEVFKKLKYSSSTYITKVGTARFLLPEMLSDLNKCIYLDCDLIVRSDLSELWKVDIGESAFGAVEEPICRSRNKMLDIPEASSHFNSGVLVLNLKRLREIKLSEIICDFLNNYSEKVGGDQDTLNVLFHDQWFALPMKWNVTVSAYTCKYDVKSYKYEVDEIREARKNPAMCHFTDRIKPDSLLCRHPYRQDYLKYRNFTFWKDMPLKDVTLGTFFMRFIYFCKKTKDEFKNVIRTRFPNIFIQLKSVKNFLFKRSVGEELYE